MARETNSWVAKWLGRRPGPPGRGEAEPGWPDLPYPVRVHARRVDQEERPFGGGLECFDTPLAQGINRARLEHLDALGLPLEGRRVLDVGCGVGHLAQFFVRKNCRVVCVDGRQDNVESLRQRYPGVEAHVGHVEVDPLTAYGEFDVVFSYGLLYHLENPLAGLRNLASVCRDLLLLETVVCDSSAPVLHLIDEPPSFNQTMDAMGCRPSPGYVTMGLNRVGFAHVYAPLRPPRHPDFQFAWKDNLDHSRDGYLLRCIFVASRRELHNPKLKSLLAEG
jgi:SAM-dependent methyltransferase